MTNTFIPFEGSRDVKATDRDRAIEVVALYKGIVMGTRYLTNALGKSSQGYTKHFLGAGFALILAALATLLAVMMSLRSERTRYEKFVAEGGEGSHFGWTQKSAALDWGVLGGLGIGLALVYSGLKRRSRQNSGYLIGSDAHVDCPVSLEWIDQESFPLVASQGADFQIRVTHCMNGEVSLNGQTVPLQQFVKQRGFSFALGDQEKMKLDCGATTFLIRTTASPPIVRLPFLLWRWSEQSYTLGTVAVSAVIMSMAYAVPQDASSISLDLFQANRGVFHTLVMPPEDKAEEVPAWLQKKAASLQGGKGKRHQDDEGRAGKNTSKNKTGRYAVVGPKNNPDPHLAKKLAEDKARNSGILGVLNMNQGSPIASIFGKNSASGMDEANVLGGLVGDNMGDAYGIGGLGLVGTGWGGGGAGQGTIGLGVIGTLGKGGGGGDGSGYGRGAGGLRSRRTQGIDIIPGIASVHGSLDKDIIRRIIRRHIHEVKYCYEQELSRKANLTGRVAVQFTITASGGVLTSVLQSSTMGNVSVENCVVKAVRRWEFPKPKGGGLVIVSYPFNFMAGGAGS